MTGAHLRTLIAAAGLGFTGVALGGACLDFAGEDWGACIPGQGTSSSSGVVIGSGSGSARLGAGSGQGSGAPATPSADCGAASSPDGG